MHVGLEATFYDAITTGHGQYVRALYRELPLAVPNLMPVLLRPAGNDRPAEQAKVVVPTAKPPRLFSNDAVQRLWWEQVGLGLAARQAQLSLLHLPFVSTYACSPLRQRGPLIITIHDITSLLHPAYANSPILKAYLQLAHHVARFADRIITSSKSSAQDIARVLHIPLEQIEVVYLAVDSWYTPGKDDAEQHAIRARYQLDGPFIYNVGGLDVRKNLSTLIKAFAQVRAQLPPKMRLVISGSAHTNDPERYPDLHGLTQQLGIDEWVMFTGRVTDDEKVALLRAATLYAYPSLYEGFGFSTLEAMSCGTPVLSSNQKSLPEVVGEGGVLIYPDVDTFAMTLKELLNSPEYLLKLRHQALARAQAFSWHQTAMETASVYADVIKEYRVRSR